MNFQNLKSKVDKMTEKLIGKREEFRIRLNRIYGVEGHEEQVNTILKKNRRLAILAMITFVVFMTTVVYQNISKGSSFIKDKDDAHGIVKIKKIGRRNERISLKVKSRQKGKEVSEEVTLNMSEDRKNRKKVMDNLKDSDSDWKEVLNRQIRELENGKEDTIVLPKKLPNNMKLHWERKAEKDWILPIIYITVFMIAIHKGRFAYINSIEKKAKNSIERDLPGFLNKIVLLMGGGMIFEKAFERAVLDSSMIKEVGNSYFYMQMKQALKNTLRHKKNLVDELYDFAKRNEDRNMMRIVGLVGDNLKKGDRLAEKLQVESQLMWFNKKKSIEEKGRISETKLVFPMVIMLGVLVVITVAPALIDI